jgi:hypothetical protein
VPGLLPGVYELSFINVDTGERSSETLSLGKGEEIHPPMGAKHFALLIEKSDS